MDSDWRKYVDAASGLSEVPRRRAESLVKGLVSRGEAAAGAGERLVEELLGRVERNREAITGILSSEIESVLGKMGLARQADLERVERRLTRLERDSGDTSAQQRPRRKSAAQKRAAERRAADKSTNGDEER